MNDRRAHYIMAAILRKGLHSDQEAAEAAFTLMCRVEDVRKSYQGIVRTAPKRPRSENGHHGGLRNRK